MVDRPLFGSDRMDWATPSWLFAELDREFAFTLDVCATDATAKCKQYFTPETDALLQRWDGVCWMNPPYGKEIGRWMQYAREAAMGGATVVCLVPSRTDTAWWHDNVEGKAEVRFLRGRLRFDDSKGTAAPFPSAIVIYRPTKRATDNEAAA